MYDKFDKNFYKMVSQSIWRDARKVSLFKHHHVKFQTEMMYRLHSVIVWSTQFSSCHKNETKRILCSSHELDSNLGTGKNCTGLNPEKKMNEESIRSPIRVNCTEIVFFFSFLTIVKSFAWNDCECDTCYFWPKFGLVNRTFSVIHVTK